MAIKSLFGKSPVLLGVIHLAPLPGSPGYQGSMEAVINRALQDSRALEEGGLDGAIIENFGDAPFYRNQVPPETIASMAVAVTEVQRVVSFPLGINVLRNDARSALALSSACNARFIRINVHTGSSVTDQGLIHGKANETLRLRENLWNRSAGPRPLIFADVAVKHAAPLGETRIDQLAEDTYKRGGADVLLITGSGTGKPSSLDDVKTVKTAVPDAPVLVASGVTDNTLIETLRVADGVIIGTWLKRDGMVHEPVDIDRVRALVSAANGKLRAEN